MTLAAVQTFLSTAQLEAFGRELDALRDEAMAACGDRDRRYILRLIAVQRRMALAGRVVCMAGTFFLPTWSHSWAGPWTSAAWMSAGVLIWACSKILENMEIAHNVMHGQWDWMNDPQVRSDAWEWDSACPSALWRHSHNVVHHGWTNVLGRDRDIGYGMLRVTSHQRRCAFYLLQPLNLVVMALTFDWFIAAHDLEINRLVGGRRKLADVRSGVRAILHKAVRHATRDWFLWPALTLLLTVPLSLSDPSSSRFEVMLWMAAASMAANALRNVWVFAIVMCGHFPHGVHHFTADTVESETRPSWYLRQLLGSCNVDGGRLFHVMCGNLSHQIEHHLFPDVCSSRYGDLAPKVRAIAGRYGIPYTSGPLNRQLASALGSMLLLSLPSRAARSERR